MKRPGHSVLGIKLLCVALALVFAACATDSISPPPESPGDNATTDLHVVAALGSNVSGTPEAATAELLGPVRITLPLTSTTSGFAGTFTDIPSGVYRVVVRGINADLVSHFGEIQGVTVKANLTSTAEVALSSFVTRVAPQDAPTTDFVFALEFDPVMHAATYVIEASEDPGFVRVTTSTSNAPSATLEAPETGTSYIRVRATNSDVPAADALPSDVVSFSVVTDITPSGADAATAAPLGAGTGVNGSYRQLNIFPAGDEDWFAVNLAAGDRVTADVLSASIKPFSRLDPYIEVLTPDGTRLASSDNAHATTVESRVDAVAIPSDDTYYLRVTAADKVSVGHYELRLAVLNSNASSVDFEPISAVHVQGPTGILESERRVIRDAESWQQFWEAVQALVIPPGDAPTVDFASQMVIAAAMGERPTGGHVIEIQEVLDNNGVLTARVVQSTPGSACFVTQEITAPVTAVVVSRTDGEIHFMEDTRIIDCAPGS